MRKLTALLTGLIFGLGLYLSGMTNPAKVLAFLDIAGDWDPSLALVMAGALVPSSLAFYVARRRQTSLLGAALQIPTLKVIDRRLLWGSLLFGAGWGPGRTVSWPGAGTATDRAMATRGVHPGTGGGHADICATSVPQGNLSA